MALPPANLRSPGELPPRADTVIVGAGIVGIATAWFLRQYGMDALVIDAADGLASRTTSMSAHCIRAQFSEPDSIAMMSESLTFYEDFAHRLGLKARSSPIHLCQQGYLFASTDPADAPVFADRVAGQRAAGLDDVELIDGDEVRDRFPWLSDEIVVATFRGRDGWIDSGLAVEAMAASAGCAIHPGVTVNQILVESGRVTGITTSAGPVLADRVVLAAGPFSGALSPEPLPLETIRRHRLIVRSRPGIPQAGPVTIDANTGAHWRPHLGGALMAWAQTEAPGPAVWPVPTDPGFIDLVLHSDRGVGRLAPFWRDLGPRLGSDDLLLTAGQYAMTPDHRPLIGKAPVTEGLYLHTGYSGHGIMGSPAGARLLTDIIASDRDVPNPFSPSRFVHGAPEPPHERMVI
jgi:sarcosine oxidase subunit beta